MANMALVRLAVLMLLAVLAGCGSPNSSVAMAPAPHYTTSVLLLPVHDVQARTIQFRPSSYDCTAIAYVRPDLKSVRCYDVLTLQLGPSQRRGHWTEGYASIRQCVARLTPAQLKGGCVHSIQTCANQRNNACAPDWTSQTSIEFLTNGTQMKKEWLTCSGATAHGFRVTSQYCGASRKFVPWRRGWLSVGDNSRLYIPNVVDRHTEERFDLRPDGALRFAGCC